jgi:hypothetical protein
MKIRLSKKQEILVSLLIAATFGLVLGSLFAFSSSQSPELSIVKMDLFIEEGQVVTAQSLENGSSADYVFPPPLYVFEQVEYSVDVSNSSGGVLQINFTRDSNVIQTELVQGSQTISSTGYGEYRLTESDLDVTFQALNADVRIGWLYISVSRSLKQYNPLFSAISYTVGVAIILLLIYLPQRKE